MFGHPDFGGRLLTESTRFGVYLLGDRACALVCTSFCSQAEKNDIEAFWRRSLQGLIQDAKNASACGQLAPQHAFTVRSVGPSARLDGAGSKSLSTVSLCGKLALQHAFTVGGQTLATRAALKAL